LSGGIRPLERLHDHRGEITVVGGEDGLRLREVVEWRDQHVLLDGVRDARGVGRGRRIGLGRVRAHAHQGVVVGAVEPALELQDLLAAAEGARHAQGEERRLAARRREAHLLRARHRAADLLREGERRLAQLEVGRPLAELPLHRRDDRGVRVPQHERPGAQDVVDVLAARHIDQTRPPAFAHHEGEIAGRRVAAEDTAGQETGGLVEEGVFFRCSA
jgi:hypothetical protein